MDLKMNLMEKLFYEKELTFNPNIMIEYEKWLENEKHLEKHVNDHYMEKFITSRLHTDIIKSDFDIISRIIYNKRLIKLYWDYNKNRVLVQNSDNSFHTTSPDLTIRQVICEMGFRNNICYCLWSENDENVLNIVAYNAPESIILISDTNYV